MVIRSNKILLAIKDPVAAVDINNIIKNSGFKVTSVVDNALDAITKAETDKPDIIILDVILNGSLNGIEAAKIISYKHKTPIIFLSSNQFFNNFSRTAELNYCVFLIKPIKKEILIEALEKSMFMFNLSNTSITNQNISLLG